MVVVVDVRDGKAEIVRRPPESNMNKIALGVLKCCAAKRRAATVICRVRILFGVAQIPPSRYCHGFCGHNELEIVQ